MTDKTESEWIHEVKEPYLQVVGKPIASDQNANQPPVPLETLAKTQAGSREALLELYKTLKECEAEFAEPPETISEGRASDLFDDLRELQTDTDYPGWTEQREKWFQYGKLRILGAFKKLDGEIPDADIITEDWEWGYPEEELQLLLLLDKDASLDTEDPELLARELEHEEELGEFMEEIYDPNRDLRQEIQGLDRPGVTYALLEAYQDRIERLNEVFTTIITDVGPDPIREQLNEAEQEVRETREDVERQVADAFQTQVVPHLESIEEEFESVTVDENGVANEEIQAQIDNRVHELRQDLQDWSITEAEDLETEIVKLQQLRQEMRRAFADERMEASEALIELNEELDALDTELETLADRIETQIEESYEDVIGAEVQGESFEAEQPVMEELARMLVLLSRLNSEDEKQ